VKDEVENAQLEAWAGTPKLGQHQAIILDVERQPGANIIDVVDHIKELLPQLKASMPQGIDVSIVADRTETVRASVHDVQFTLVLTLALVVLVVFLFLGSVRATVIPGVAVPLSLIGTFGVMKLLDFSLDNLSLMALTISTGFVVDDAIVVTENITRAIEAGETPLAAAFEGAAQIGFTIVSITLSLLAVFVPVLLMGGIVGRLFREFAVTLSVSIGMSAVISLTVTPMMCSRMLRSEAHATHGRMYTGSERVFTAMLAFYEHGLRWALRHRVTMLLVTLLTVGINVALFVAVPKGLFPQQDTGLLMGASEAGQDVSFAEMFALQEQVNAVLSAEPNIAHYITFIGSGGFNTGNTGSAYITLSPLPPRTLSADQVLARLRGKLSKIAGIKTYLQSRQDVSVGGHSTRTQYQYTVEDANLDELREWAPRVLDAMRKLSQIKDVNSDQENAGLQLDLDIDRDTASRLGVTARAIDDALYDVYGQRFVATTFTQRGEYRVVLEGAEPYRSLPDSLDGIYVKGTSGAQVPLRAIAKVKQTVAALAVNHNGQFPAVTLSFNLAPNIALGQAVDAIDRAELAIHMPPSVHADFQGTAHAFTSS
ncbi:MAG: efflux RND transporter permease subunit, partial [Polyangiaceae bacterium]